jgi:hypothetical protein
MRRSSTTRKLKKSKKRRYQRGGNPINFQVVLFSEEQPPEKLQRDLQHLLKELYGEATKIEDDMFLKYSFEGITGLPNKYTGEVANETVFSVKAPEFLSTNVHWDTRLTALEGQIADKILEQDLPISLIPPPHGISDDGNSLFIVGLSYPVTYSMRKGQYQRQINRVRG